MAWFFGEHQGGGAVERENDGGIEKEPRSYHGLVLLASRCILVVHVFY